MYCVCNTGAERCGEILRRCGGCEVRARNLRFTCPASGLFPQSANCSLFFECSGAGTEAKICWCNNLILDVYSGECVPKAGFRKPKQLKGLCQRDSASSQTNYAKSFVDNNAMANTEHASYFNSTVQMFSTTPSDPLVAATTSKLSPLKQNPKGVPWYRTFVSFDTWSAKQSNSSKFRIIHDSPIVPIWVLAMLAYSCVTAMVFVAMCFFYKWTQKAQVTWTWLIQEDNLSSIPWCLSEMFCVPGAHKSLRIYATVLVPPWMRSFQIWGSNWNSNKWRSRSLFPQILEMLCVWVHLCFKTACNFGWDHLCCVFYVTCNHCDFHKINCFWGDK